MVVEEDDDVEHEGDRRQATVDRVCRDEQSRITNHESSAAKVNHEFGNG